MVNFACPEEERGGYGSGNRNRYQIEALPVGVGARTDLAPTRKALPDRGRGSICRAVTVESVRTPLDVAIRHRRATSVWRCLILSSTIRIAVGR
jgi:hypothetical protein